MATSWRLTPKLKGAFLQSRQRVVSQLASKASGSFYLHTTAILPWEGVPTRCCWFYHRPCKFFGKAPTWQSGTLRAGREQHADVRRGMRSCSSLVWPLDWLRGAHKC